MSDPCMASRRQRFALLATVVFLASCSGDSDGSYPAPDAGLTANSNSAPERPQPAGYGVSPTTGVPDPGSQWSGSGATISLIGGWTIPLTLPVGSTVPALFTAVRDNASTCSLCSDGVVINMMLVSSVGSSTTVISSATSTGSGQWQNVSIVASHTVTADELLQVRYFTFSSPVPPSRMSLIGILQVGSGAIIHRRTIPLFSSNGATYTERPLTLMSFPAHGTAEFPVPVEPGEIFADVTSRVRCGSFGAVTMRLIRRDASGAALATSQVGSAPTCAGLGSEETLQVTGMNEVAGSDFSHYLIDFTMNNPGPVSLDVAYVTTR